MRVTTVAFLLYGIFSLASSEDVLKKGDNYFYQGNNEAALKMYECAYRDKPHTYDVLVRLVQVHADNGYNALSRQPTLAETEYKKAAQYADTLLRYFPEFSENGICQREPSPVSRTYRTDTHGTRSFGTYRKSS